MVENGVSYNQINKAVNEVFFDGRYQGKYVYLDLDVDQSDEIANKIGCTVDKLATIVGQSVLSTLSLTRRDAYLNHMKSARLWLNSNRQIPPPFTTLLLCLSMAAEKMRYDGNYSASNYYFRLFETLNITNLENQKVIRNSGNSTVTLWNLLNNWLIENDYSYGIPTAKKINSWRFVSYAISQSLVRENEKEKFRQMFREKGITQQDRLGFSDVELMIHQWMATSSPSIWLKKLWSQDELRERIVTAALYELEQIDDYHRSNTQSKKIIPFHWMAVKKTFPKKGVSLFLTTSVGAGDKFEVIEPILSPLTSDGNKSLCLAPLDGTDKYYLHGNNNIKLDSLLSYSIEIKSIENKSIFRRNPKPIVILTKSDDGAYYKEANNISLYSRTIILCHDSWSKRVDFYLDKYARNGYVKQDAKSNSGLPDSWVIFDNVEIVAVPSDDDIQQMPNLSPMRLGATIQLVGGIKLYHNIWHPNAPPEVIATLDSSLVPVSVLQRSLDVEDKIVLSNKNEISNTQLLYNDLIRKVTARDFVLAAHHKDKYIAEKSISFRTAEAPRNIINEKNHLYGYQLSQTDSKYWLMNGAILADITEDSPSLRGYLGLNVHVKIPTENIGKYQELNITKVSFNDDYSIYSTDTVNKISENCILRGYHIWECEAFEKISDKYKDFRFMQCKDCKVSKTIRKPHLKYKESEVDFFRKKYDKSNVLQPKIVKRSIDINDIFDGLCYVGSGNWATFERISSGWALEPWDSLQLANNLFDLGHIDLYFEHSTGAIKYWSVSPSCIVVGNNQAFLSGFRNSKLISKLESIFSNFERISAKQDKAPDFIGWKISEKNLLELKKSIESAALDTGITIKICCDVPSMIASYLPSRQQILSNSPALSLDKNSEFEIFEPNKNRWSASELHKPGAYRKITGQRIYFFFDKNKEAKRVDVEFAKILSSIENKIQVIKYNKQNNTLQTVIGCQPARIFRRALVSSTGKLPYLENDLLTYENVSQNIAFTVIDKIYG